MTAYRGRKLRADTMMHVRIWHLPVTRLGQSMPALPSESDVYLFRYG